MSKREQIEMEFTMDIELAIKDATKGFSKAQVTVPNGVSAISGILRGANAKVIAAFILMTDMPKKYQDKIINTELSLLEEQIRSIVSRKDKIDKEIAERKAARKKDD